MRATAAQRGLWYAHSVAPDPAVFTIGHLVDFDGAVDVERLTPAVRGALDESDGLRSRFDEVDGDLLVTLGAAVEVGRDHLGGNPALIDDVAAQAVATPMDPVAGPVAAVTILSAGERISLLIVAHHIVLDAYGIGLFTRRVAQLYADPDGGRPLRPISSLPDDVDASVDGDAEFWDTETSGIPDPSSLSGGPGIHRIARAVRSTAIVVDGVATTPPGRLTAAIVAFCARSTDAAEVVLGFPMMNRFGSPAANTPCTLVNVVPLRVATPLTHTLDDLTAAVGDRQRRIAGHARHRGEDIVRAARRRGVDGVMGPTVNIKPFGATISFGSAVPVDAVGADTRAAPVTATLRSLARGPVIDLSVTALDVPGGVELVVDADADRYDAANLDRLTTALAEFVAEIHRRPDTPIGALDPDRRGALVSMRDIVETDSRTTHHTDPTPIVDRILRAPAHSVAVRCDDVSIEVGELDRRSAAVAAELGPLDPEDAVALLMPRGVELIAAMVAVLRSGAAFVPLDPAFPAHRIAAALEDADPVAIIEPDPAGRAGVRRRRSSRRAGDDIGGPHHPDHPAYLIYTSGTTGAPKGVVIPHRALQNFTDAMIRDIGYRPGHSVLAVTTISFDIAILETLVPLAAGATVVLATTADVHDPGRLVELITRHRIRWMQATPSLWTTLADAGHIDALREVDVLVGGEQLSRDLAGQLVSAAPSVRNMYGPTETTIWSTLRPLGIGTAVTIGDPIENTGVRILDSALRPVTAGRSGELYLTGHGLARGYRHQSGLTATRFVADPFGVPGARMYRTGDLARRAADDSIECLGRTDHQVKVRGFRIELGEIESVLAGHPAVEHAVVTAPAGRLVGYLIPAGPQHASPGNTSFDPAALRAYLGERLPDYMVPAAFVAMERFPLTANGKIDRRALPAPDFAALAAVGRPPTSDLERQLASAFCEVLGLPEIGVDDNFFGLGGDSITAVRLVSRIGKVGVTITALDVFDHPTVAALVRVARTGGAAHRPPDVPDAPAARIHSARDHSAAGGTTADIADDEMNDLIEGNLL